MGSFPLRLPPDVEADMQQLARQNDRSLNGEIIQACKAWITSERKGRMQMSPEQVDQWAHTQLEAATDEMQEANIDITPENLSAYFEKHYELPFTPEEAKGWLEKQSWYE